MRNKDRFQQALELSEYLKGLKALFEGMEDGPIQNLEPFQMVQLLSPATERIDRLMKSER